MQYLLLLTIFNFFDVKFDHNATQKFLDLKYTIEAKFWYGPQSAVPKEIKK